jgi:hypothetical protein
MWTSVSPWFVVTCAAAASTVANGGSMEHAAAAGGLLKISIPPTFNLFNPP